MVMPLCGARLAVPHRVVRPAIPGRVVQLVIRPGVVQPVVRPSASVPITSAPERTVRTQSASKQPEGPPPVPTAPAAFDWTMVVAVFTIIGVLATIFTNSISELKSELGTKLDGISKDVAANTTKLDANTTKLEAFGTNIQAQQVQTAKLQGQVGVLLKVVAPTKK